jgi:hypothetical protein
MTQHASTLHEIEEKIRHVKASFIETIKNTAAQNEKFSSLKKKEILYTLNRELCVCRALAEELEDNADKAFVIYEIKKYDSAIFQVLFSRESSP